MTATTAIPKEAFPTSPSLAPDIKTQSDIAMAAACGADTKTLCHIPVRVGLFFDGTNNNLERDRNGERIGVLNAKTKKRDPVKKRPLKANEFSHSNVARLFRAYPGDKAQSGYFSHYMPGVGTAFPYIGEASESYEGKAFAKGGQPRIIWALLQVVNSIHMTVTGGDQLYEDNETGDLAQDYDKAVGQTQENVYQERKTITHADWFEPHLTKLKNKIEATPKPIIPSLTISVFGFSRGAAEAAAFCHLFADLLGTDGKFVGIFANIDFLGVFDTVATVGVTGSVAQTTPVPGFLADGHFSWAKRILKPLPACVKSGLHLMAAHEQRMNFPSTELQGGEGFKQHFCPGVHSDVGGGYAPGEQGKGRNSQSAMLSQIPLKHMFEAARLAGVPLKPISELEQAVKDDFEISPEVASAWDAYHAAIGKEGFDVKKHMALYYRWRAARLHTLEKTASFQAADPQAQQDLRDSNRMLIGDLDALKHRAAGRPFGEESQITSYANKDTNQYQGIRAGNYSSLDQWEKWAFEIFNAPKPLPADVMQLFDDYVHDSIAGFYLAGEVTEYDKRIKIAEVMQKDPAKLNKFDQKVHDLATKTRDAQKKKEAGEVLTPDEEKLASEAEYGTPFPLMTDDDSADMRNPAILTQTRTRREGGGYFLPRGRYPGKGFIYLQKTASEQSASKTPETEVSQLQWSEDVMAAVMQDVGSNNEGGRGVEML